MPLSRTFQSSCPRMRNEGRRQHPLFLDTSCYQPACGKRIICCARYARGVCSAQSKRSGVRPAAHGVLMFKRHRLAALFAVSASLAAAAVPARAQNVLYNNGPDGDVGYYGVNFGAATTNSFALPRAATITTVELTLYDVDDRNHPQQLRWLITTEPLGGRVMGEGVAYLTQLGSPYPTRFLFFAWDVSFPINNLILPEGTYYLQIEDVMTRWGTYAFWAQSGDGNSQATYQAIGPNVGGTVSQVQSESFSLLGEWSGRESRLR